MYIKLGLFMRYVYGDHLSANESQELDEKMALIGQWWQAFESQEKDILKCFTRESEMNLPEWMQVNLQAIHPEIMWEFGPGIHKEHRLVITPESNRHLRPLVRLILSKAPVMRNWEFYNYRQPVEVEHAIHYSVQRGMVDLTGVSFEIKQTEVHRISVKAYVMQEYEEEQAMQAVFLLLEMLMGEQFIDQRLGEIFVEVMPSGFGAVFDRKKKRRLNLQQLKSSLLALIGAMEDQLPDLAFHARDLESVDWHGFTLEPPSEEFEDFPYQSDLLILTSCWKKLAQAYRFGGAFYSRNFSKHGEVFCYLKLAHGVLDSDAVFERREALEQRVDKALRSNELGAVIGTGYGTAYSYLELALSDVLQAIPFIREAAIASKAEPESWLLFHDVMLEDEWMGIYPDSPLPPQLMEE